MSKRDAVFPANPNALYDLHDYSPAVRHGDLLFVAGQVGARPDGSPEPDFEAQVRLAFENLGAVLTAAGSSFEDVLDVTSYHTDPENQFETVLPIKKAYFPDKPHPAWSAFGVNWLAGFDFEIKVVARIPAKG